jgi:4-hydroxy-2-oxoglutarate aldolase
MTAAHIQIEGIFPPVATPFQEAGEIGYQHLRSNLERWEAEPLSGYVVGGSNGEFTSLSNSERVEMVRFMRENSDPARLVIAGSGLPSTQATIDLGLEMTDAGASALLVITPIYFKSMMSHDVLVKHFHAIADGSRSPILLYNMPANTGIDMSVETILAAAEHPNIIGIKDSSGRVDKIGAVVQGTPEGFVVLAGSAGYLLAALAMGAVGSVAALANIAGAALQEILEDYQSGDMENARTKQLRLIEVNRAVTARFGVPGLKAAMDMLGYYGGPVRTPLQDLGGEERAVLRNLLVEAGLL